MYSQQDVLDWIDRYNKGKTTLKGKELEEFIEELHKKIVQMDYSVPDGATIIGYSGQSNKQDAWKIAKSASEKAGDKAVYISKLNPGEFIGKDRWKLEDALKKVVGNDEKTISKIISGGYYTDPINKEEFTARCL